RRGVATAHRPPGPSWPWSTTAPRHAAPGPSGDPQTMSDTSTIDCPQCGTPIQLGPALEAAEKAANGAAVIMCCMCATALEIGKDVLVVPPSAAQDSPLAAAVNALANGEMPSPFALDQRAPGGLEQRAHG